MRLIAAAALLASSLAFADSKADSTQTTNTPDNARTANQKPSKNTLGNGTTTENGVGSNPKPVMGTTSPMKKPAKGDKAATYQR